MDNPQYEAGAMKAGAESEVDTLRRRLADAERERDEVVWWLDSLADFYDSVRPGGPVLATDPDIGGVRALLAKHAPASEGASDGK